MTAHLVYREPDLDPWLGKNRRPVSHRASRAASAPFAKDAKRTIGILRVQI
jgi:hypothetical protein